MIGLARLTLSVILAMSLIVGAVAAVRIYRVGCTATAAFTHPLPPGPRA